MARPSWWGLLLVVLLESSSGVVNVLAQPFTAQHLGTPYGGEHTGVATADLNNDGYIDLIFSAGRHTIDQSFVLINLGSSSSENGHIRFSSPLPIGNPGGYYQADASKLSSIDPTHTGILLAGGVCTTISCGYGSKTAAVVLDVLVTACSVQEPDKDCEVEWSELWRDPDPQGDRNGAFAMTIGDGVDPAIVLVNKVCTAIFFPADGKYGEANLVLTPDDKDEDGNVNRGAGIATGFVGGFPGIVVGARTRRTWSPGPPIVVLVKLPGQANLTKFTLQRGEEYEGSDSVSLQPVGLALGDLDGDGLSDLVVANFLQLNNIVPGFPVPQRYYLLDSMGYGESDEVFDSTTGARSVDIGHIFTDSELPDIVYGASDSSVRIFANLGVQQGKFLGFQYRFKFNIPGFCEVRTVKVVSLKPCSISVVCALNCNQSHDVGNYVVHSLESNCRGHDNIFSRDSPKESSTPSEFPSLSPTFLPSVVPSDFPTQSINPSTAPSESPSFDPTILPSSTPSQFPTKSGNPSSLPSDSPSASPTISPSFTPSSHPTISADPTSSPSDSPSVNPTRSPSSTPSAYPTISAHPTSSPSVIPSANPTTSPSFAPSSQPTISADPTSSPSGFPSLDPTNLPSSTPSFHPTESLQPSSSPSNSPSVNPTISPSVMPSIQPTKFCGHSGSACTNPTECCSLRCVLGHCREIKLNTRQKLSTGRGGAGGIARAGGN